VARLPGRAVAQNPGAAAVYTSIREKYELYLWVGLKRGKRYADGISPIQ